MPHEAEEIFAEKARSGTLVIFGCGYIGGQVGRAAKAAGLRVVALTRNTGTADSLQSQGIEAVVADLADNAWHARIPNTAEYILNSVSSGGGGLEGYRKSYLRGMESVIRWLGPSARPGRFVYTSSTSVYPQDEGVRVTENSPVTARDENAAVLIETEQRVQTIPGSIVLRLGGIYGPARVHLVEQVRLGEVSGSPGHHLNLIHRDDAAAAVAKALVTKRTRESTGVFNVVDDHPTPKGEVASWLADWIGVKPPRFTGAPVGTRRSIPPDRIIANDRIKGELKWTPQFPSFREGYAKFLSR